jgi:hypothetical protein
VGLAGGLGLSAEVGGGAGAGEEAADNGLEEGLEDDLGTAVELVSHLHSLGSWECNILGLGEGHPKDQDKLEDIVEGCSMVSTLALILTSRGYLRNQ